MTVRGKLVLGAWDQRSDQGGVEVRVAADIRLDEFQEYLDAIQGYQSVVERPFYELLHRSWNRLTSMHSMYTNLERVGGQFRVVDRRTTAVGFAGEVTTWLAISRLYLESQRDMISRYFGKESTQLSRYREVTSYVFDANEGYRFLYNLRDYAQHCGAPLGGLTLLAADEGDSRIELYLSRSDLLLANFQWSKHTKKLLEAWPEEILLLPLMTRAMEGFQQIEDEILRILMKRCIALIEVMRHGINRVTSVVEGGHPAVFQLPDEDTSDFLWQSFPNSSDLSKLELALEADDPVAASRSPLQSSGNRSSGQSHAEGQAAAVIGTWLEHGPGNQLTAAINNVLREDQSVTPLVSGLVNICAYLLSMLSQSIGTPPEALLGGFVERLEQGGLS
jgi:hypothetical protein